MKKILLCVLAFFLVCVLPLSIALALVYNSDVSAWLSKPIGAVQEKPLYRVRCAMAGDTQTFEFRHGEGRVDMGQSGTKIYINNQHVVSYNPSVQCEYRVVKNG